MEDAEPEIRELLDRLDAVAAQMVTKGDLAAFEARVLKWYVGTTIALTVSVFAIARLIK